MQEKYKVQKFQLAFLTMIAQEQRKKQSRSRDDSAVMMVWFLVQSELLDKQHVFHQQVDVFCRRSLGSIFPINALVFRVPSSNILAGKRA